MGLRTRIIHWLGGICYEDFTPVEQAVILQMQADRARDEMVYRMLERSMVPNYYVKKKKVCSDSSCLRCR